jgi:hypothetical protein
MFTEQMIAYMQSNSKLSTASTLRAGRAELVGVGVLLESYRIYNFKGISRDNWWFCSTIELPKY